MTLSPRFEELHRTLSEQLKQLPSWKQEALRRDQEFFIQRRHEPQTPERQEDEE